MKEQIKLSIPTPCHEKWKNFLPTEQGRFCQSCNKEVIDFTKWSDNQIKEYFKNTAGGTCGRFRKDQLKAYPPTDPSERRHTLLSASLVGIGLMFNPNQTKGEAKEIARLEVIHSERNVSSKAEPADTTHQVTINGKVKDGEDGSPLPGVNVVVKGRNVRTTSDADGVFTIDIHNPQETDTLIFSFVGFEPVEKPLSEVDGTEIILKSQMMTLGGVVAGGVIVRRWTPRGIWWNIRNIFR